MEVLLIDARCGVYIPKMFTNLINDSWKNIDQEDIDVLGMGPDHEEYWDTWNHVIANTYYLDKNNNKWILSEDQDLWMVNTDDINYELVQDEA
jgi:hypothetical protein